ncbi:hypothetical protein AVEN_176230-1 [Araneus ventricosus]|uniref:Uncharacterized protein n=1 Tax=Araneus ventricosus TaxID=182803 RepID=A0A4Y2Q4X9_ARAVE|nr:hypothetical protein AVEN_176230-1 [Araneus ventricosus]
MKDPYGPHLSDRDRLRQLLKILGVITRIKNTGKLEKDRSKYRCPYAVPANQLGPTLDSPDAVWANRLKGYSETEGEPSPATTQPLPQEVHSAIGVGVTQTNSMPTMKVSD